MKISVIIPTLDNPSDVYDVIESLINTFEIDAAGFGSLNFNHQHFTNPSLQVNEYFKSYVNDLLSQVTEDLGDAFAEVTNFFSEIFQSESLGITLPFINISI